MYGFMAWGLILLSPLTAVAGEVSYSAIVMDLSGQATATRLGKSRPLELGATLYPQEEVETAAASSLTINYLESGDEEEWPGGLKFAVGKTQSDPIPPQVKRTNRKVVLPSLDSPDTGRTWAGGEPVSTGAIKMRGSKPLPTIGVQGLANCATLKERPTFGWFSCGGAEMYRVTLYVSGGDKPLWQRPVKGTTLPYPQGEPSLAWGCSYMWEVEALKGGVVIAKRSSCFSLPPQPDIAPIKAQKEGFAAQLAKHPGDTPTRLAFIFFLESHHLYDEAAAQYGILREARKDSQVLKNREAHLMQLRDTPCNGAP
jgi:hypothetical protein